MRAASARVAAATSSWEDPCTGTTTCSPLDPLVFTAPESPAPASASRASRATATTWPNSPPSGGSRSSTSPVGSANAPSTTGENGTCSSTARWLASHSSVRRSSTSTWCTSRRVRSDHVATVRTHSGAPLGRSRCTNAAAPGRMRTIVSGRPDSSGTSRSAKAS